MVLTAFGEKANMKLLQTSSSRRLSALTARDLTRISKLENIELGDESF